MKILLAATLVALSCSACASVSLLEDTRPADASLALPGIEARVVVYRDALGIPYIAASSLHDALVAQGFVTAQDRLYQLELMRHAATGRLAELIGERGLASDILIRTLGIPAMGMAQAARLSAEERNFYAAYLAGLNTYIEDRAEEHPPALARIGVRARAWTLDEMMGLQIFQIWSSSVNWREELLSQQLIDRLGADKAAEISQQSRNPDDGSIAASSFESALGYAGLRIRSDAFSALPRASEIGSNAWAVAPERSASGAPMLASDPHIEFTSLPGFWYPVGLFTPELRALGGGTPGTPGLGIGRTDKIAFGATNGYADVVDLYLEQQDPDRPTHYLEGSRSIPFETRSETLHIRDRSAPGSVRSHSLEIRRTRRGPVVSDQWMDVANGRVISLRWSIPEGLGSELGSRELLLAGDVEEARHAIEKIAVPLNHIVADVDGNIARVSSGFVPMRVRGDGSAPLSVVDGSDAWQGLIPGHEMPSVTNPESGWVGAANHRVVPASYPYVYSSYFAPRWRYERLIALLQGGGRSSVDEQWGFLLDTHNPMAERIAPLMASALQRNSETRALGDLLASWDFVDRPDQVAPLIFQATYRNFAKRVFRDELGAALSDRLLRDWYYWHERLESMLADPENPWFDDRRSAAMEGRDDLFRGAAMDAAQELREKLGDDLSSWEWGRLHTLEFRPPLMVARNDESCPGAGTHALGGSGETLARALYRYEDPYAARVISSLRFLADLGDPDKLIAVVPGGVSGRCGDPHGRDQTEAWLRGEKRYWWFSDSAIRAHAVSKLELLPN